MTEQIKVDSEGDVIAPRVVITDSNGEMITTAALNKLDMDASRYEDLESLEDAIFGHGSPVLSYYLSLYSNWVCDDKDDLDEYLTNHNSQKRQALKYCWETLRWRPNTLRTKVIKKHPNNNYDMKPHELS